MLPVTTILLLSMSRFTKAPIIASERSYPARISSMTQVLLRHFCKKANGWVFQTPQVREWYGYHTGNARVAIIPNPINEAFIKPAYVGIRQRVIVAIGRMCRAKNYPIILQKDMTGLSPENML